ncbi:MAG TPA: YigZ family protein [Euzebya sp.]|nr:YigZ family protein [Euzebya sp.]
MVHIRTVAGALSHEGAKVRGSRFIADVAPAGSDAAALAVVQSVRDREPSATHHCWGFRLHDGRERGSDDGEPSGTAAGPILRHLGGADLVDVVLVVTRYYGGTKLGTGGLIRAYGLATAEALGLVEVVLRPVMVALAVQHDYELSGPVDAVLAAFGTTVVSAEYGAAVSLVVEVGVEVSSAFTAQVVEATSGRVVPVAVPGAVA